MLRDIKYKIRTQVPQNIVLNVLKSQRKIYYKDNNERIIKQRVQKLLYFQHFLVYD